MNTRDRLALAADVPLPEAVALYSRVALHFGVVKVGLSLFVEHGPLAVRSFLEAGAEAFLDLKLHDIPNTVELAAARASEFGISYLTVHAGGGAAMVAAAVKGAAAGAAKAGVKPPIVLAVTVLTSLDSAALASVGVGTSAENQARALAQLAVGAGAGGIVCSANEAAALRAVLGPACVLCTPGIRPSGADHGDQARVATPAGAINSGADLLVVGRPVYTSADPAAEAARIFTEVAEASRG